MKRVFTLITSCGAALAILTATSCKKTDDTAVCRIVSSSYTDNTVISTPVVTSVTYDVSGRIASVSETAPFNYVRNFTYSGNTISIVKKSSVTGTIISSAEVVLNNNGSINSITSKSSAGLVTSTRLFTYDANGKVQSDTYQPVSGSGTTTSYQFSAGNLASMTSGTSTVSYQYYTDKAYFDADFLKFAQLTEYASTYLVNSNLLKSYTNTYSGNTGALTYEFNDQGYVSKSVLTEGNTVTTNTFTYDCQ